MAASAEDFGAPDTEPGGSVAAAICGQVTPGRSEPDTVVTRWASPGCSSVAQRASTRTVPSRHTWDRSLRTRSAIMTFSA